MQAKKSPGKARSRDRKKEAVPEGEKQERPTGEAEAGERLSPPVEDSKLKAKPPESRGEAKERRRRRKARKPVLPSKQDHQVALEPVEEAFAQAEEKERAARGWSIDEAAVQAVVKRGTIQHLEHRRRGVSLRVAFRIARSYGKTLSDFLAASGKVFFVLLEEVLALGMA